MTRQTEDGKPIIRRYPDEAERMRAARRRAELLPWIQRPYNEGHVSKVLAELSAVYGSLGETPAEAAIRMRESARLLLDTPLWAIKRSCDRFAQGTVKPEELNGETVRKGRPPSPAMVHAIAAALLQPVYTEIARLHAVLDGRVVIDKVKTPADKERVAEALARYRSRPASPAEEAEKAARARARENTGVLLRAGTARMVLDQYADAGVDPPPGGASLPLVLRLGGRVEDDPVEGRHLTLPPRMNPTPRRR